MRGKIIGEMDVDKLTDLYVQLSAEQGSALYLCKSPKVIRDLGYKIFAINLDLKQRPGDQRIALMPLFHHSNPWVRFNAACCLIEIAPVEARQVVQTIADSGLFPEAGHAAMFLSLHDGSLSKLTDKS